MIQLVAAAGLSVVGRWPYAHASHAWDLSETKRLEDSKFVCVSFWGGVIVVDCCYACVDEEQGEGGQAGRGEHA